MINVLHLFILVLVSLVSPRASAREYEEWFVPFRYAHSTSPIPRTVGFVGEGKAQTTLLH